MSHDPLLLVGGTGSASGLGGGTDSGTPTTVLLSWALALNSSATDSHDRTRPINVFTLPTGGRCCATFSLAAMWLISLWWLGPSGASYTGRAIYISC
jgi:hypothetical protein